MIFWLDAQLPPSLAPWLTQAFGVEAYSLRYIGLHTAEDGDIFDRARRAGDVDYHRIIAESGLGETYAQWTQRVAEIAAAAAVPFRDFNAQGFELGETPPGPRVRGEHIRWFWEPAHYTAELGEVMLAKILGQRTCSPD